MTQQQKYKLNWQRKWNWADKTKDTESALIIWSVTGQRTVACMLQNESKDIFFKHDQVIYWAISPLISEWHGSSYQLKKMESVIHLECVIVEM